MIYHIFWAVSNDITVNQWNATAYPDKALGTVLSPKAALVEFIKSSKDDTFIFVLVKGTGQWSIFKDWVTKNGLQDHVVVCTDGITNPVHADAKHNLVLAVMQSADHFQRKEEKNAELQVGC
jgi:hypothetical protein